jgi:hypothetical protein
MREYVQHYEECVGEEFAKIVNKSETNEDIKFVIKFMLQETNEATQILHQLVMQMR